MCFVINKWKSFTPTKQYLSIVSGLTSVTKLHQYSQKFKYIAEKGDYWKTPIEFLNDGGGDCEDFARFTLDVLHRILNIEGARFVIHSGYDKKRWGNKLGCHAITVFPYNGKLALFNNNEFKTGYKDYIDTGHYTFIDGLKTMVIRNNEGKIISRKFKIFGVF